MKNVFVQTNDAAANQVVAFSRGDDGSLETLGWFDTGGRGDGVPHLTSQGSVVLTSDGRGVLVTNAGSGALTLFAITNGGLQLLATVDTGAAPKSAAEHDGLVYVLNTGDPSLVGFRIDGGLTALADSRRELSRIPIRRKSGSRPTERASSSRSAGTTQSRSIQCRPTATSGSLGRLRRPVRRRTASRSPAATRWS